MPCCVLFWFVIIDGFYPYSSELLHWHWGNHITRTHGCVWNDSEMHKTVLLDCTTGVRFTVILHTPGCSRFYHIHIVSKWNWNGVCLMILTRQSYLFFLISNLFYRVAESWWNMPSKGTQHGYAVTYVIIVTLIWLISYDVTPFEHVLWRNKMHEWVMNIHYQTWIAQGQFINISHTLSKQWGVDDNKIAPVPFKWP